MEQHKLSQRRDRSKGRKKKVSKERKKEKQTKNKSGNKNEELYKENILDHEGKKMDMVQIADL